MMRVQAVSDLHVRSIPGVPAVSAGDQIEQVIISALGSADIVPRVNDVIVVASKIVSRAEGRFFDLATVEPTPPALELGTLVEKDPRLVELILRESVAVSRARPGVLITRHRLGFVSANAGIDASNASPGDTASSFVLLLPIDPDASAAKIANAIEARFGVSVGVLISDSHGRPFRLGAAGVAIGAARIPVLSDERGRVDRQGRTLEASIVAVADSICAIADLAAGQADEARPLTLVRGLSFPRSSATARDLNREPETDLFA